MSCPKCKDTKTPFCGACGSRIKEVRVCPWCKATNDAGNSFCQSCGEKIAFKPFVYSKRNISSDEMTREILRENTQLDEKKIKRFITNMEFNKDCQCKNCGENNEIGSVRHRDLFGVLGNLGFSLTERTFQVIEEPSEEVDEVEEKFGLELVRVCLVCGNVWFT